MNDNIEYYCRASRGRDPNNPSDRTSGNPNLVQRIEVRWDGLTNTITSVAKDNYILVIEKDSGDRKNDKNKTSN